MAQEDRTKYASKKIRVLVMIKVAGNGVDNGELKDMYARIEYNR